jgi:hypothetical protein
MYCETFKSTCRILVALYSIILFTLFWWGYGAEMGICRDISFNILEAIFPHAFRWVLILAPMIPIYTVYPMYAWQKVCDTNLLCLPLFLR